MLKGSTEMRCPSSGSTASSRCLILIMATASWVPPRADEPVGIDRRDPHAPCVATNKT
jgi:hypothetical protein